MQQGKQKRLITSDVIVKYRAVLVSWFSFKTHRSRLPNVHCCHIWAHYSNGIGDPPSEDTLEAVKLLYISTNRRLDVEMFSGHLIFHFQLSFVFLFFFFLDSSVIVFRLESKSLLVGIRTKQ